MSWRFRKTFKVLPGVKLNLTRHGLSATLGASGEGGRAVCLFSNRS
jgi:hypothetical protein